MKALETSFKKNEFNYEQILRDGDVAIFSVKPQFVDKNGVPSREFFETIIVQKNKAGIRFGKHFESSESYPSDAKWGKTGFTHRTLEQAMTKLSILKEKLNKSLDETEE